MFPRGRVATPWAAEKRGGGGNPRKFPARRGAPAAFAAVLTGLAALSAAPPSAVAQTCASAPTVAGTPSAAPSAWTFGGTLASTDTGIDCNTLTNGLAMTLGPDLEMGTEGTPLTERGIFVDAEEDGDNDVTVTGAAVIHSSQSGIYMKRDGTGLLGVELTGGRIAVTGAKEGFGIWLRHKGEAGEDSRGVRIVSGADIDLSGHTKAGKAGISVTTTGAPEDEGRATTTVPVTVRVTGGTIDVGTSTSGNEKGSAVWVNQYAKGDTAITVEPGAALGREGSVAADYGIYVLHQAVSEGDITITHRGRIYGGTGINARNESTSGKKGKGNIAVTTDPGSVIVAKGADKYGILAGIDKATGTGDITVTHNGGIDAAERSGIYAYNLGKGDVSVTTGRDSVTVSRGTGENEVGVRADVWGNPGKVTVVHRGGIAAKGAGIRASNRVAGAGGTGTIGVTTERGSAVTAERQGILVWHRGTGRSDVTVRGTVRGDSAHTEGSDTEYAGVRIQVKDTDTRAGGGGGIVIGPMAHVSAKSGTAIKVDARAGAWTVVLERDTQGLAGHVEGKILNADSTATAFSARTGEDGAATALKVGDRVDMRVGTGGVFDAVHRTTLETVTGGHEFKKLSETRVYHDLARVYEALPSVLLDLVRPASPAGRAAVTRDGAAATRGPRAAAAVSGRGWRRATGNAVRANPRPGRGTAAWRWPGTRSTGAWRPAWSCRPATGWPWGSACGTCGARQR